MLLTIDAGNTKTKWAIFNAEGQILNTGACLNALFNSTSLPSLDSVSNACISNVAGKPHADTIEAVLNAYPIQIHCLKSTAQCCNVTNLYTQPETLGTDRWASLIAAWHLKHAPCVVVNAGTAITIDALLPNAQNQNQAEFIGGMILPGLSLMQSSLRNATAQLDYAAHSTHISGTPFNTSTADAMLNGALSAVCGAIHNMLLEIKEKYQITPLVIMSGGDAEIIKKQLFSTVTNSVIIVDNLVLSGLYLIDRAQHQ